MVELTTVRPALKTLIRNEIFIAVFVGGTSGIAEYTLRVLAKLHAEDGKVRIYIVGRNLKAAETIITDCKSTCPKGQFKFVQAKDLSLLKDVDRVCSEVVQLEQEVTPQGQKPKLDLLVMGQACSVFQKQKDTEEGLDFLMSLMYYSRMRFIIKLLPLLLESTLPARIVSIYAAGMEAKLIPDDLSLRNPANYGYFQARSHICYMKTAFMETLATKHPGKLSLTHLFPGLVVTPGLTDPSSPWWFSILYSLMTPFLRFVVVPPDEVGARVLYVATPYFPARESVSESGEAEAAVSTDGILGGGAYIVGQKSEIIPIPAVYKAVDKKKLTTKLWKHTMAAFDEIEAGRKFTG